VSAIFTNLILSMLLCSYALAETEQCVSGQIRSLEFGKLIYEKSSYCFNSQHNELISKNCFKSTCVATQSIKPFDIVKLNSVTGNPGFKLCRVLGGQPRIIEFSDDTNWFKLDQCTFNEDHSFVDTGTLTFLVRKKTPSDTK